MIFYSLISENPSEKKYLDFTSAYIKLPLVVATKVGVPFIDNLNSIREKSFGIVKNYSMIELLKKKYPNLNLIEVDTTQKGLSLVEQEKIFGFLDNSMVINDELQKNNINNVAITGQFLESFNLSMASRNDEHILNKILGKSLSLIDNDLNHFFVEKWNNIKYQIKMDYQLIIKTLFIVFVFIIIVIYWNLKLKEEIKIKEIYQNKLTISEERFRTLFNLAPILLNAFDQEGKITLWNKECEKVFGWKFEELEKEKDPLKFFYPDPLIRKKVIESININNQDSYREWSPITKSGQKILTKWANVKLLDGEIINVGYDITQERYNEKSIEEKTKQIKIAKDKLKELNNTLEKRIEDEINKNTKQQFTLMNQSKLVQMGEMIENIAHQWRQPLAQINTIVLLIDTILKKNKLKNSMLEDKLLDIEKLTEYMSKTIDDFQNFFNPSKEKKIYRVENTLQKSFDIVKGLMNLYHIKVIINVEKDLESLSYEAELEQVLLIILNNAIDAIIQREISLPKITVNAYTQNNDILINIEDNANGIKSDNIEKIFEPYFTTKQKSQGTGVGLYMAKMIIENGLKGSLFVENKLNGACFTIIIPKEEQV